MAHSDHGARTIPATTAKGELEAAAELYAKLIIERGYSNGFKLACIFDFWLQDFLVAFRSGKDLPANCLNLFATMSVADNLKLAKAAPKPAEARDRLKGLFWYLVQLAPLSRGVLPGGARSPLDPFRGNATHYKLKHVVLRPDPAFKAQFLERLGGSLEAHLFRGLKTALPDIFFSREKRILNFPRRLWGSPACLLDETYLKSLFLKKKLELNGVVHGAHYGEILNNRHEEFENKISDSYYHWGLGKRNIRQNRFGVLAPRERSVKRLVFVGSVKPNEFICSYFPGIDRIFNDSKSRQETIVPRIAEFHAVEYLMHPKFKTRETLFRKIIHLNEMDGEAVNSSLFIMDKPGNTFLYKAIYESIPFVLYYNREWNRYFPDTYLEFLRRLEDERLLFHWDRDGEFLEHLRSLVGGRTIPASRFLSAKNFLERGLR